MSAPPADGSRPRTRYRFPALAGAAILAALFLVLAIPFIPLAGIQNDEALFAQAVFGKQEVHHFLEIRSKRVPLLLMSYLGTFKAWLYHPIFFFVDPGPWSLRLPAVLICAAALVFLYTLTRRTLDRRTALIAGLLLATDPTYILTGTFDWGPVALRHILLLGGLLLLNRFEHTDERLSLAGAFFLFGLALWDKALFSWNLTALAFAAAIVFPGRFWPRVRPLNIVVATAAFLAGAWPVVHYNVIYPLQSNTVQPFQTFRSNAGFDTSEIRLKLQVMRLSLDGGSLFGYIPAEPHDLPAKPPQSELERVQYALADRQMGQRSSLFDEAVFLSFMALPVLFFAGAWRPVLFALIFCVVTWLQMAFTRGAGAAVHHTVFLWPFPHIAVAAVLARLGGPQQRQPWRPALMWTLAALIILANLSILNLYWVQFKRNGTSVIWSDAIPPLRAAIHRHGYRQWFVADWGMQNTLHMLERGRTVFRVGSDPLMDDDITAEERSYLRQMLEAPDWAWVGHVEGKEIFQGVNARLTKVAAELGWRRTLLETVLDSNGRPVFELYRFERAR